MEKKLIIAVVLSVVVIGAFQFLFPRPSPQIVATTPSATVRASQERLIAEEPVRETDTRVKVDSKEAVVQTEKYILTFTDIGGSLKDIKLKDYTDSRTGAPLHLVSDAVGRKAVLSMESNALIKALAGRKFDLAARGRGKITYTYTAPEKFKISKEYKLHNSSNYIELRITIQNLGNDTIYRDYDLLGASGMQSSALAMSKRFIEIDSMIDGKLVKNNKVKNGEDVVPGIISWTGVKERYFCIVLKPQQDSEAVLLKQFGKSSLASGVRTKRIPIYSRSSIEDSYMLYIGPNDMAILNRPHLGLGQIINYGFFGGISKVLLVVLRVFHKVVRNWGVAIIMLTFLINIIMFPLTKKSLLSMKKIQEIQPHIEKLRAVHKDNPQKLNKELADVYRQYNVNPFGGCLPMLVQMPIFIALYQGLMRSIELKGAHFLWIKDLSRPDYVHIPFTLPLVGNEIHVLPLLMVGAMFFQQKLSTKSNANASNEQKQQQKIMLIAFPLFFGFLFYNFPSGLVLYWLTNTILMVIEHSAIRRST